MIRASEVFAKLKRGQIRQDGVFDVLDKLAYVRIPRTLVFLEDRKHVELAKNPCVSVIICPAEIAEENEIPDTVGIVVDYSPRELFFKLHEYLIPYMREVFANKIDTSAVISEHAIIADHSIEIGPNCVIEENVVIKPFVKIGSNTIIRSGTVVGSEGFEVTRIDRRLRVVQHGGWVLIGNGVEIQTNCNISRGLFPSRSTVIHDEVCIDALVHIAHAVQVGPKTKIAAGTTIGGNVVIGENVWIGPGSCVSNGVKIGDGATISLGSVVVRDVREGSRVTGNFAVDHEVFLREYVKIKDKYRG